MAMLLDVLTHFGLVFHFIDRQHHEAVFTQLVVDGLHGRYFRRVRLAPGAPKIYQDDFPAILTQAL
jgi:hypothetical protein